MIVNHIVRTKRLPEEAESQHILVMGIPKVSIEELLDEKVPTQLDMTAPKLRATLEILPGGYLGIGSFKSAVRGRLTLEQWEPEVSMDLAIRVGWAVAVACKRFFVRSNGQMMRLTPADELLRVHAEGTILYWANALLRMCYSFMARHIGKSHKEPPHRVPEVRFVNAAIGLSMPKDQTGTKGLPYSGCFVLEEIIHIPEGAKFTKFIGNASAKPLVQPGEEGYEEAVFLAFCQHVQYEKTQGMAYISDLQGMCYSTENDESKYSRLWQSVDRPANYEQVGGIVTH